MASKKDNRICRRSDVDVNWRERGDSWGVDLGEGDVFPLDCVWWFGTQKNAVKFLALVDGGMDPLQAASDVMDFFH